MDMEVHSYVEQLITEIEKREVIWNRLSMDDGYNRLALDMAWKDIAINLQKPVGELKVKWKHLRDQFQREFRKGKVSSNKNETYTGSWVYFKNLYFLKDIVQDTLFTRSKADRTTWPKGKKKRRESEDEFDDATASASASKISKTDDRFSSDDETGNFIKVEPNPFEEILEPEISHAINFTNEKKKTVDDDGDLSFLKSLHPYMNRLPPVKKLVVRNKMLNLLISELMCNNCKRGDKLNCTCPENF